MLGLLWHVDLYYAVVFGCYRSSSRIIDMASTFWIAARQGSAEDSLGDSEDHQDA
jgi:hypothetical protein